MKVHVYLTLNNDYFFTHNRNPKKEKFLRQPSHTKCAKSQKSLLKMWALDITKNKTRWLLIYAEKSGKCYEFSYLKYVP